MSQQKSQRARTKDQSPHLRLEAREAAVAVDSPEEEGVKGLVRHERKQLLHQLQLRLVEANVDLSVDHSSALLLSSLGDSRVAVTEVRHSDTRGEVNQSAASVGGDVGSSALLEDEISEATNSTSDNLGSECSEVGHLVL